jgi:SH3-like domain-containing protein
MTARRIGLLSSLLIGICFFATAPLYAQTDAGPLGPEIENSKYQFTGVVNSNAVYVRSGPSENDYPTMKLDKGADVTVLGIKFEWLKITPPEGSFCYVAKAFVDRHGNGSSGRVTSTLNVRVGSQLNELKAKIASKLEPGAAVEIVGEEQEYFKIKPPEGVFFYVNKQFVDPVRPINLAQDDSSGAPVAPGGPGESGAPQTPAASAHDPMQPPTPGETDQPLVVTEQPTEHTAQVTPEPADAPPSDANTGVQPEPAPVVRTEPSTPATQPTAAAEAEFERLESAYAEATVKPLMDQPVSELLDGYQKLADGNELPESLRRIAEFKAEVLKSRLDVQKQFTDTRKQMDEMSHKQMALRAEREELEQRIKESDVRFYTAVGTLRPSSLQQGTETLYRLTDPANGRTVVYVRTNDQKLAGFLGQFIGVRGEVQTDGRLNVRVITPTAYEEVNPAKVGDKVAAQIVPPSLLPGARVAEPTGTAGTEP